MRLVIIIILLCINSCVMEDKMISISNKLDKIIELLEQETQRYKAEGENDEQ